MIDINARKQAIEAAKNEIVYHADMFVYVVQNKFSKQEQQMMYENLLVALMEHDELYKDVPEDKEEEP